MSSIDFPQTSSVLLLPSSSSSSNSQKIPNDELIASLMSQSAKETEANMKKARENWAQNKSQRDETDKAIAALAIGVSTTARNYHSFHAQSNEEADKARALSQQITVTSHTLRENEQHVGRVEQIFQGVDHALKKDEQKMDQINISLLREEEERAKLNQELQNRIQNSWRLRAMRALGNLGGACSCDYLVEKVCSCFNKCLKGTLGIAVPTILGSFATGFTSGTNNGFAAGAGGGFLVGSTIVFTCFYNKRCRKTCCSD